MGRSLARCLFQKGGEFRPTKRKRRRAWPVCESGNDIGQRPMSIPSTPQNARFINGNGIGHRPSRKVETTSGNARCLFLNLHPPPEPDLVHFCANFFGAAAILGDFRRFWAVFEDFWSK